MRAKHIIASLASLAAVSPASAHLTEPDTTFYGRVLHHGGGEPHVITSGSLSWRVVPPGGGEAFTVKAELTSWENGAFSYSVRVPRSIAVSGLPEYSAPAGLPVLADSTQRYRHAEITVDGHAARPADPAALSFAADGAERADFIRLDLIVDFPLADADSDGLPDWWETKYGLDAANPNAGADFDSDGMTDLAEFQAGTNPALAGTAPLLAAESTLTIPQGGRAALLVKAQDSDSPATLLRYTAQALPAGVTVVVQDGASDGRTDRPVVTGGSFTQAEIDAGRVIFTATQALENATATLSLVDEAPGRAAANTTLQISTALPADLLAAANLRETAVPGGLTLHYAASQPVAMTLRGPSGPANADDPLTAAAYQQTWVPAHGADTGRLLIGTPQDDILLGSGESDVLSGGEGSNTLRGHSGADRFVFTSPGANDTVADFTPAEGDVLDVSALLSPAAGRPLAAYLSLQPGATLRVDADGDGSGYTDAVITLTGADLSSGLDEAWDAGLIDAGSVVPRTTLFVSGNSGSEEGLAAGSVSFRRRGDATQSLTVPIVVSGTATAGVDYVPLPASITFAAGAKTASLTITPLADDLREPLETIVIALQPNAGYDLSTGSTTVSLADLPSRAWLEITERAAYKDSLSPAQVLVRRSGTLGSPLTVLLQTSGRATAGVDYRRPASSLTFAAGQDVIALDIQPLSSATLTSGCEDVVLSLRADSAYLFGATPQARLVICERPQTFTAWRAGTDEAFLDADTDGDGFNGLMEFALGLNPDARDTGDKTLTRLVLNDAGVPGLEYRRWPAAPEVNYEIWQSADLQNWTRLTTANSAEASANLEADGMERVRHFLNARPAGGKVYLRLKVTRN